MIPVACGQEVVACGLYLQLLDVVAILQVGGTKDAIPTNLFLLIPIVLCFLFFQVCNLIELYNFLSALSAKWSVYVGFQLISEQEEASTEDDEEEDVEEEEDEREELEEMCEKSNAPQNGGASKDKRRGTFSQFIV